MPKINLKEHIAFVDEEDAHLFDKWHWYPHHVGTNIYVRGYIRGRREETHTYLHRVLLGAVAGQEVDHINGNGLDNRKANLRFCTRSQNNANRQTTQSRSSPYKGVHFEKQTGKWRAEIHKDGKKYRLGRFERIEDAAEAYKNKSIELYKEFSPYSDQ